MTKFQKIDEENGTAKRQETPLEQENREFAQDHCPVYSPMLSYPAHGVCVKIVNPARVGMSLEWQTHETLQYSDRDFRARLKAFLDKIDSHESLFRKCRDKERTEYWNKIKAVRAKAANRFLKTKAQSMKELKMVEN